MEQNKDTDEVHKENETAALAEEYKCALQRLQAEFDNYKKRVAREQEVYMQMATASLVRELLGSLDAFEEARRHEDSEHLRALHEQLKGILLRAGLEEMQTQGEQFDPHKHEVVLSSVSAQEEGKIIEVLQKGYLLGDQVLRHAKVHVNKHDDTLPHEPGTDKKADA